jgi:diguanylate cyclase (GGDEF)-like protein/PAS domain S-box-containing protein
VSKSAEELADLQRQNEVLRGRLSLCETVLEHIHQGLCVLGPDGRIALCNRRYAEVIQLPPEQVYPGLTARELVTLGQQAGHWPADATPEDLEMRLWDNLARNADTRSTLKRGDRTHAVRPTRMPDGYWVTTFEDISAQVEAETALRESEARLKAILDAMPDCVKIFDETGRIVHINPEGLNLLEASDLESLNAPGYMAVPEEYRAACLDVHRRVMDGESVVWTYEVVGLKGRRRHVEAHAVPFRMPDGSKAHMCISRDVDERLGADTALRHSEERLRLVQEATGLADFECDAGGVLHCSDRFFEQLGLPAGDGTLKPDAWAPLVHPDDRERLQADIAAAQANRDEWFRAEFRIVRADNGETRWIACNTKMMRDETGALLRTIGAHLDITERKRSEDASRSTEKRLRLVQEATGLADFEATADGIAALSDAFVVQTGLPPGTNRLPFAEWLRIVHPEDREQLKRDIEKNLAEDDAFQSEFRIVRPDNGEVRWISSRTKVERNEAGEAIRSIGAHLDITRRKASEEALRESEERFRLAAEAAGLGVWDYDAVLNQREWSDRLREILGIAPEAEATLELAESCIHPADRPRFMRQLHSIRGGQSDRFEDTFRIRRPCDDEERWVTMNGWRTHKAESQLRRIILTARDATVEKTAEERVRWTASHDGLTGLANRSLFQEKLDHAIQSATADGGAVGLLLLDLDHFKQINDTLGHDAGDMLLKMFAERLRSVVRTADTVSRFGGDEFGIVLPDVPGELSLIQLSRSIHECLREPFVHAGRILDCRVSIGASMFPMHGRTHEALMKNADIALYAAKAAGRGTVTMFEPHMRDDVQRRATMVQTARDALRDDRVVPYYQPKLDLSRRAIVGFEALLRWRTDTGRIGEPAAIEAAFEDAEVAAAISDRMIDRVIADMRVWLDRGIDFQHVAVNASAAEFRRDNFAEGVLDQLRVAKIPPHCFQLEVTETVFLGRGAEYVHRALALLNARGVKIALDDFGTGYASLRHLKQFPVDIIKIDRSFVRDMDSDPGDEAIIRAVVNLGRSLHIKVVAEGIETEEQSAQLMALECDFGQGFLFSKAVAASRVPGLVTRFPPLDTGESGRSGRPLRLVAGER